MRNGKFVVLLFLSFLWTGCARAESESISFVCWNVQTFFDAQTDGTEYSDFKLGANWSKDKYVSRLTRLCQVIKTLDADIFAFEEIENESVLYDISNQLAGDSWNQKERWNYACFAKDDGAATGCGIISRFPLKNQKVHAMDIRCQKENMPSCRPIVQATAQVGERELVIFVCHWKSKSGGEEETEIWRDWQESVLGQVILTQKPDAAVICGDFNRNAGDFVTYFNGVEKSANTIFRIASCEATESKVELCNSWFDGKGGYVAETGSYFYNNNWDYIDNIFTYGNVKTAVFGPKAQEPWATENNIPVRYVQTSGEGYSDHLPLMCKLVFEN